MRTADGVEITHGLRVWTNDLEAGFVDLESGWGGRPAYSETNHNTGHVEWWFDVKLDKGGHKLMSESRVATRHPSTRERA